MINNVKWCFKWLNWESVICASLHDCIIRFKTHRQCRDCIFLSWYTCAIDVLIRCSRYFLCEPSFSSRVCFRTYATYFLFSRKFQGRVRIPTQVPPRYHIILIIHWKLNRDNVIPGAFGWESERALGRGEEGKSEWCDYGVSTINASCDSFQVNEDAFIISDTSSLLIALFSCVKLQKKKMFTHLYAMKFMIIHKLS